MSRHRIFGILARRAVVRRGAGDLGTYGVHVELAPTDTNDHPIVAARDYGHGANGARAAARACRHLRQGMRVYVHCCAIGIGHTSDAQAAIRCIGVDLIESLSRPVDFTAPREPIDEPVTP